MELITLSEGRFPKPRLYKTPEMPPKQPEPGIILTRPELSTFEMIRVMLKASPQIINLLYRIFLIIAGAFMFKDPKTTITAIIGLLAYIVKTMFNFDVAPDIQAGFVIVVVFLIGLFAKDGGAPKV